MAEFLARSYAERCNVEVEARSAGTLGLRDRGAEPSMIVVGREIGLDLTTHVCQPLTAELCAWADHVLVMELNHLAHVAELGAADKGELLGRYIGTDEIPDPIGAWFTFTFRRSRNQIEKAVKAFLDTLPSEVP